MGDTPFVLDGSNALLSCLSNHQYHACGFTGKLNYWGLMSPMGDWPLLQHIPDLIAIGLGASSHAVRTRVLTVQQIHDRLTDRFGLLTGGGPAALPRHQTLRTTIDWSHDLLTAREQTLLRRLCVFGGRFRPASYACQPCLKESLEADQPSPSADSAVETASDCVGPNPSAAVRCW